jgi:NAD(P)-dependent dehydrogenase (short-subunit alcohol dehydrogenase family)
MSTSPKDSAVLITGAAGGIGQALCAEFLAAGWHVLATDHPSAIPELPAPSSQLRAPSSPLPALTWLPLDLAAYVRGPAVRQTFAAQVRSALAAPRSAPLPLPAPRSLLLTCLVNNAAVQRLGATAAVTTEDWDLSLGINLVAPFLLAQAFLPELEANQGSVVNIASIHAQLTKPGFVVYATTKAALSGMTRALAVDLGSRVRVNAICPAAIATPMLEAGFAGRPDARRQLDEFHPAGQIGQPAEVARLAVFLARQDCPFLTGSCLTLDGAISGRLHDPA